LEFYADSINKLNKALPDVQVYAMFCPTSIEFNAPAKYQAGIRSQLRAMNYAYSHLDVGIAPVDTWSSLYAHRDEYIYFRTDHHWTQLGAYYAYTAFCEAAGFDAVPLEQFQTGRYDTFLGSMYTFTKGYPQSDVLKQHPDYLDYYLPIADTHARYYADGSLENGTPVSVVYTQLDESVSNKYLCFIGGDTPVCIVESDVQGPTCIVLKESYGNAFVPFLTSHYGRIIVIDPREFNQEGKPTLDLAAFAADQGVDDLIVINYPYMINSKAFVRYLNALAGVK
ncbi:MAG: DHHW family protein, partial [Clostridiales bacterium]|nr:DHHW family protein [Clostridiales bacterium]